MPQTDTANMQGCGLGPCSVASPLHHARSPKPYNASWAKPGVQKRKRACRIKNVHHTVASNGDEQLDSEAPRMTWGSKLQT